MKIVTNGIHMARYRSIFGQDEAHHLAEPKHLLDLWDPIKTACRKVRRFDSNRLTLRAAMVSPSISCTRLAGLPANSSIAYSLKMSS